MFRNFSAVLRKISEWFFPSYAELLIFDCLRSFISELVYGQVLIHRFKFMIMVNLFLKTFAIGVGLNLIAAFSLSKEFFII